MIMFSSRALVLLINYSPEKDKQKAGTWTVFGLVNSKWLTWEMTRSSVFTEYEYSSKMKLFVFSVFLLCSAIGKFFSFSFSNIINPQSTSKSSYAHPSVSFLGIFQFRSLDSASYFQSKKENENSRKIILNANKKLKSFSFGDLDFEFWNCFLKLNSSFQNIYVNQAAVHNGRLRRLRQKLLKKAIIYWWKCSLRDPNLTKVVCLMSVQKGNFCPRTGRISSNSWDVGGRGRSTE